MNILYVSGSPRKTSNTDYLLKVALAETGGRLIKLTDYRIEPCKSCWFCQKVHKCVVEDDMTKLLIPELIESDGIVLGSPVYFNNVSAQLKAFMDRTWCIRDKFRNKIGGTVVVGRHYGFESAVTAVNAFFLKHEMIPANRGVCGIAFERDEVVGDREAVDSAKRLGKRILELLGLIDKKDSFFYNDNLSEQERSCEEKPS
ncbi:flavodoxin family protein [candidate division WOR-3 bacterium]|uniref:Flavodoxin family protein n=1 Tax=candidate division WOR-3 bacterium TaxID=2052148 RepID=A0A9D5KAU3_UNCW3|nr:flavodoxin family protein [candidate division WOR-3 bacterium]MBD3365468.1 flavodoxin family protein [candidate division WOR-3 bacterium]